MANEGCVLVFTSRPIKEMRAQGGSQAWVLDPKRARRQPFLVAAWNSLGEHARNSGGRAHGEGFLVAKISAVEPATPLGSTRRYIIRFDEYAKISVPDLWPHGQRNPVFYTSLSALKIDPSTLIFKSAAPEESATASPASAVSGVDPLPLTMDAAKRGLAAHYGVDPNAIEITIRG